MARTGRFTLCTFLLFSSLVSCASDLEVGAPSAAPVSGKVATAGISLPQQVLGLQVKPEDVSAKLKDVKRTYISSTGLFSFRESDLVRATLQVSKFNLLANPKNLTFRKSIVDRLGSTKPQTVRIGDQTVYMTTSNEQQVFAWFEGKGFFVLSVHRNYEFPRTLLRRLVGVENQL